MGPFGTVRERTVAILESNRGGPWSLWQNAVRFFIEGQSFFETEFWNGLSHSLVFPSHLHSCSLPIQFQPLILLRDKTLQTCQFASSGLFLLVFGGASSSWSLAYISDAHQIPRHSYLPFLRVHLQHNVHSFVRVFQFAFRHEISHSLIVLEISKLLNHFDQFLNKKVIAFVSFLWENVLRVMFWEILVDPNLYKALFAKTNHFWFDLKVPKFRVQLLKALQSRVHNTKPLVDRYILNLSKPNGGPFQKGLCVVVRPTKLLFLRFFEELDLRNIPGVISPPDSLLVVQKLLIRVEEEVVFLYLGVGIESVSIHFEVTSIVGILNVCVGWDRDRPPLIHREFRQLGVTLRWLSTHHYTLAKRKLLLCVSKWNLVLKLNIVKNQSSSFFVSSPLINPELMAGSGNIVRKGESCLSQII